MHQTCSIRNRLNRLLGPVLLRHKLPGRYLVRPVKFSLFQKPATILHGRAGAVLFEQAVEIGEVVKAGFAGDLVYGFVGVEQEFAGVSHADVTDRPVPFIDC